MRLYESVILVQSNLDSEQRDGLFQKLESVISENNGKILKKDEWGKKKLAYEINKQNEAHYSFYEFYGNEQIINEMKRLMKINEAFLRHIFVNREE